MEKAIEWRQNDTNREGIAPSGKVQQRIGPARIYTAKAWLRYDLRCEGKAEFRFAEKAKAGRGAEWQDKAKEEPSEAWISKGMATMCEATARKRRATQGVETQWQGDVKI